MYNTAPNAELGSTKEERASLLFYSGLVVSGQFRLIELTLYGQILHTAAQWGFRGRDIESHNAVENFRNGNNRQINLKRLTQ